MNLATLTYLGCYQILSMGVSLSGCDAADLWVCSTKWRNAWKKSISFCDELSNKLDMHGVDDLSMCLCSLIGHVCMRIDVVYGGYGQSHRIFNECY